MQWAVVDEAGNPHVAVKELTSLKSQGWSHWKERPDGTEKSMLLHFGRQDHPHLIQTIARYTQGVRPFFMFPWAKGGNLRNFWKEQPSLSTASLNFSENYCSDYIKWFFEQLLGLSGAIDRLHNPANQPDGSCRHGNLKPENILCFCIPEAGDLPVNIKLVIADTRISGTDRKLMYMLAGSGLPINTYGAPEAVSASDYAKSLRYDIWSIGCLYLEFLIWMLYGNGSLEKFHDDIKRDQPYTFYRTSPYISLKPEVRFWIKKIKTDSRCAPIMSTAVGRLINLIEKRLLVVDSGNLPRDAIREAALCPFEPSPIYDVNETPLIERAHASEMLEEIEKIVQAALAPGPRSLTWINWNGIAHSEQRGIPRPAPSLGSLPRPSSTTGQTTVDSYMWSEEMKSQIDSINTLSSVPESVPERDEEPADDHTVYDMVPSVSLLTKTRYITYFVDQLFREVTRGNLAVYSGITLGYTMSADDLTELFKSFSLKIGYDSDHLHRKIMAFAYQNSRCVYQSIYSS